MKLLLLLSNVILFSFLISTCHKKNNADINKTPIEGEASSTDTTKNIMGGIEADTIYHAGDTTSKDDQYSKSDHEKHEAPKHDSPEQMKIDSLKKSKEKKKKG